MERYSLQHVQLFRSLARGFSKGGNTVQLLELSSSEIRHRELPQVDGVPPFHHRTMEPYLARQHSSPVAPLLDTCRTAVLEGVDTCFMPANMQQELGLFLQYLLQRQEGLYRALLMQASTPCTPLMALSTEALHAQGVAQLGGSEDYLPLLYRCTCGAELLLPYCCVYPTRVLLDSISYAVPLAPQCLLLFVHAHTHRYFCEDEALHIQTIATDSVLRRLNDDAVQAEQQTAARLVIGSLADLKRAQGALPGRKTLLHDDTRQLGS